METIVDRLERMMDLLGLNNNSLTVRAKLSVGLVAQARKNRRGLHSDTIEKVLNALPQVSPGWFVLGEGTVFRYGQDVPPAMMHEVRGGVAYKGYEGEPLRIASEPPANEDELLERVAVIVKQYIREGRKAVYPEDLRPVKPRKKKA